jgi:hypothetical protein
MTAVEYYNQEIKELFNMHQDGEISSNMFHVQRLAALTKAKEMERQQLKEMYLKGIENYDPTFKQKEQ